jgi:hypothetical protein
MILVPLLVPCRWLQAPPIVQGRIESPHLLFAPAVRMHNPVSPSRRPVGMSLTPPAGPKAGLALLPAGLELTTGVDGVGGPHGPNTRRPAQGGIPPPRTVLPLRRSLAPLLRARPQVVDALLRVSRRRFIPIGPVRLAAACRMLSMQPPLPTAREGLHDFRARWRPWVTYRVVF